VRKEFLPAEYVELVNKATRRILNQSEALELKELNKRLVNDYKRRIARASITGEDVENLEGKANQTSVFMEMIEYTYPEFYGNRSLTSFASSSRSAESSSQSAESSAQKSNEGMEQAKDELKKNMIGLLIIPYSRILWIASSINLNSLRPYLVGITPLVLSALVYFNLSCISELYTMLINVAGVYVGSVVVILCTVLHFLVKMLFMIRRANNSVGLYDRLVNFVANYSFVMYSLILLISVGIVYCSGDFSVFECYGCIISCDAPITWGLYF
jgi:hypothetical protein